MPKPLHEQLHNAAEVSGRSYNAEIVARLQQSFDATGDLDAEVREIAQEFAEQRGLSLKDALNLLVHTGSSPSASALFVKVTPGMTLAEIRAVFEVAKEFTPPDASIVYDATGKP